MTIRKTDQPFLWLLLPFITGLVLANVFNLTSCANYTFVIAAILLILFLILNFAYQHFGIYKTKWVGGVLVYLIMMLAGIVRYGQHNQLNYYNHFSKTPAKYLLLKINDEPKLSNGYLHFCTDVLFAYCTKPMPVRGQLLVNILMDASTKNNLNYGDEILVKANYTTVEPPLNPAEFNYKAYLANKNIYQQLFIYGTQFKVLKKQTGNPLITIALSLRQQLVNKLKLNMADTNAVTIAEAMLLGYRAELKPSVQQLFAEAGVVHVLVVSGMQVAFIYGLISLVLGFLSLGKHDKILKALIMLLLIWVYALITGFAPSVCRASLMLTLAIAGFTYNQHINRLNLLAVAAFVLLMVNPFLINDAGFRLSFLAVLGIIILQAPIYHVLDIKNPILKKLWLAASVSIAVQAMLWPLLLVYFHQFPVLFLLSNLLMIFPAAMVMYAGLVLLMLPQIPFISAGLGKFMVLTINIMTKTLGFIENIPYFSVSKIWMNTIELGLCYLLIAVLLLLYFDKRKLWLRLSLLVGLILCAETSFKMVSTCQHSNITFFSLGSKEAILFKAGRKGVLLTDLPDTDKTYRYSVQPCLDSLMLHEIHKVSFSASAETPLFIKKGVLLQFENQKILIFDKSLAYTHLIRKVDVDCIYIAAHTQTNLLYIKQTFNFKNIIVGCSVKQSLSAQLKNEAMTEKINFVSLRGNKACIIASN